MGKLFLVSTVLALVVYTISWLVPLKYRPHDHILIGIVTAEELRAHLAAESLELQNLTPPQEGASGSTITETGGLIVGVAPEFSGLISAVHFDIALQIAQILYIHIAYQLLSILQLLPQAVTLASPDPPPRRTLALI